MTLVMQDLGWSDEHSFQAAPAVGPDTTVRLLAIADMGQAQQDHSNQVGWHGQLVLLGGMWALKAALCSRAVAAWQRG